MKRFTLTGAPGAGKTATLLAATDVIVLGQALGVAEPWADTAFTETIADLQHLRRNRAEAATEAVQLHDWSAVCTLALARHLGHPVGETPRVSYG